jgi:hypothetical protein
MVNNQVVDSIFLTIRPCHCVVERWLREAAHARIGRRGLAAISRLTALDRVVPRRGARRVLPDAPLALRRGGCRSQSANVPRS